jgi:hypothetical protein
MDRDLAAKLVETKPDIVFNALHLRLHDATAGHGDAVWHQRLLGQYLVDRDDRGGEDPGDALERNGHRVTRIDMDRDLAAKLVETKPDIVRRAWGCRVASAPAWSIPCRSR